jgi:hypothetical protein
MYQATWYTIYCPEDGLIGSHIELKGDGSTRLTFCGIEIYGVKNEDKEDTNSDCEIKNEN